MGSHFTVAGTISLQTALRQFDGIVALTKRQAEFAKNLLREISQAGGSFGFDGFEQNGCAAPTPFLLIIDAQGNAVYGVDLAPCTES